MLALDPLSKDRDVWGRGGEGVNKEEEEEARKRGKRPKEREEQEQPPPTATATGGWSAADAIQSHTRQIAQLCCCLLVQVFNCTRNPLTAHHYYCHAFHYHQFIITISRPPPTHTPLQMCGWARLPTITLFIVQCSCLVYQHHIIIKLAHAIIIIIKLTRKKEVQGVEII